MLVAKLTCELQAADLDVERVDLRIRHGLKRRTDEQCGKVEGNLEKVKKNDKREMESIEFNSGESTDDLRVDRMQWTG